MKTANYPQELPALSETGKKSVYMEECHPECLIRQISQVLTLILLRKIRDNYLVIEGFGGNGCIYKELSKALHLLLNVYISIFDLTCKGLWSHFLFL